MENGDFEKKKSGEWAKSRKGQDIKSNRTRQKNKIGDIEKWDPTESPEIPDRRRHKKSPAYLRGRKSGVKMQIRTSKERTVGGRYMLVVCNMLSVLIHIIYVLLQAI